MRRLSISASLLSNFVQAAFRERRREFVNDVGEPRSRWLTSVLLVLAVGVALGRLGPFDTFSELRTGERYAYWVGLTLLMWLQGVAILALVNATVGQRWPRWTGVVVAAMLASIPTAFEVAWAEMLLRVGRDLGPIDLLAIMGDVALLSVPLLLLTHGWVGAGPPAPAAGRRPEGADSLIELMDLPRRGALLAMSSEDHYVRLYTDRAEQLVAMRFGDALAHLGSEDGLQVHRRWWAATAAIRAIDKDGDGLRLLLSNGLTVPVSRSYAQQVRKAWPDRFR